MKGEGRPFWTLFGLFLNLRCAIFEFILDPFGPFLDPF